MLKKSKFVANLHQIYGRDIALLNIPFFPTKASLPLAMVNNWIFCVTLKFGNPSNQAHGQQKKCSVSNNGKDG
jgi:hypothetical protein